MVSFDHREPGTAPEAWTAFLDTVDARPVDLTGSAAVLVVAPHPDDETLGAGGLIAAAADAGLPVHVVLVSLGEGSHPDSPTTTPDELARRRAAEFRDALAALHPDVTASSLGVPDVGIREQPETRCGTRSSHGSTRHRVARCSWHRGAGTATATTASPARSPRRSPPSGTT